MRHVCNRVPLSQRERETGPNLRFFPACFHQLRTVWRATIKSTASAVMTSILSEHKTKATLTTSSDGLGRSERKRSSCPYLDTINRRVLDFDFEKSCSVSLTSGPHIYGCLVCGKYFAGRGSHTPACEYYYCFYCD